MIRIKVVQFTDGLSHDTQHFSHGAAHALGTILKLTLTPPFLIASQGLVSAGILPQ